MLTELLHLLNGLLGQLLVPLLLIAGVWFTFKLKAIQFFHFAHMFKVMKNSRVTDGHGISSFQALCTSLAARVGTGNLMGVAVAISIGGPGAIFWMWLIALLGMATAFAESTLAQLYKEQNQQGNYRGGPAYYMLKGLKSPAMALVFSICLFIGYGIVFSTPQAYTIAEAFNYSYGIEPIITGVVLTTLAGIIVMGGMKKIASFSEMVVPFMGVAYFLVALWVILTNLEQIPGVLKDIVFSALGLQEAGAGMLGMAMMQGIRRGLYSNEAGLGSVPHAAAAASPNPPHPVSQGYVQMSGVFFDTIVLCTCTAMIILLSGIELGQTFGIQLTQQALENQVGFWGSDFIALAIFFFGFTSIVANYAYAENALPFLKMNNKWGRIAFLLIFLSMIFYGSIATLGEVLGLADLAVALMTIINVSAIVLMTKTLVTLAKDYNEHIDRGEIPHFVASPEQEQQMNLTPGIWQRDNPLHNTQASTDRN
ncbi:alanine/glycine:cation symporter family protein [Thalassotalea ponticola]|uniref:alanine/glycine:cation symporter family protein n=1 Tax=Thalassotalea ponticola TaxID=1523392 RepID=UPI0025B2AC4D|nr:alanine/glycine:cation symporter family protein [Thalassotalea ponticola]MDN3653249.1 alanine/glycine:cation symporter family protein [Thalassotalea ponticola]